MLSQKTQYALRALFELSKRSDGGPQKIADVAEAQAIPTRFLEVILHELKRGGFVDSKRGKEGGYFLVRSPADLTVGEVIRFLEGPIAPVGCAVPGSESDCPLGPNCVFLPLWREAREALSDVFDSRTFRDLVNEERERQGTFVPMYRI